MLEILTKKTEIKTRRIIDLRTQEERPVHSQQFITLIINPTMPVDRIFDQR